MSKDQKAKAETTSSLEELMNELPIAVYTTDAEGTIDYYNTAASELWGREPKLGQDKWCGTHRIYKTDGTYLPHEDCPMGVAIRENKNIRGVTAVGERPDGSRFPFTPYPTPIKDSFGRLVGGINMLVDTSNHTPEKDYSALKRDLDLQIRTLTKLHELSALISQTQNVTTCLEAILETVVDLHQAQFGLISLYNSAQGGLCPSTSIGFDKEALKALTCVVPGENNGACGTAFATKTRVFIEDTDVDLRFRNFRDVAKKIGFVSVHSTPVITRNGTMLGVLSVQFSKKKRPNEREIQVSDMCARYVAQVISAYCIRKS